jgi:hypothetical protein
MGHGVFSRSYTQKKGLGEVDCTESSQAFDTCEVGWERDTTLEKSNLLISYMTRHLTRCVLPSLFIPHMVHWTSIN